MQDVCLVRREGHRAEASFGEVVQDDRISAVCQVVDNGRRKLQKVQVLSDPGTGDAEHDSHFSPSSGWLSVQAGLITEGLADGVPVAVRAVELDELALGQAAESGESAGFLAKTICMSLAGICSVERSYGSKE